MVKKKVLSGNEIIVQGALEAGFSLYTGYPGSPLADFFSILYNRKDEFKKKNIRVVLANSEAHAAAMASGAKMAHQNTIIAMKSMGLHVASDALSVGNFAQPGNIKSGVVVVTGDDPWCHSTSTPADSRFLYQHLHIPFLVPSDPQELKDWMTVALKLSQESNIYIGVLLTTSMAEGGGVVDCYDEAIVSAESTQINLNPKTFNLQKNVMVPPNSFVADKNMIESRFTKIKQLLCDHGKEWGLIKEYGNKQSSWGIISFSTVGESTLQAIEYLNLLDKVHVLKLGCVYPIVPENIIEFLKDKTDVIIIEEKRAFVEVSIKNIYLDYQKEVNSKTAIRFYGKSFPGKNEEGFVAYGGISFEMIVEKLQILFDLKEQDSCILAKLEIPARLPTFCPGCPHRETLSLLKEIRGTLDQKGIQLITHGDVGCYSLAFLPPFKEMHDLSAMGQGGALASGCDLFTTNPAVVLMGDSTFFHSGITTLSHSLQNNHRITYILLDNDNTAMTGHQMTPVSGMSVDGSARPRQNILEVVKGLGIQKAIEVHPSDRYFYKNILENFILEDGLKVIVSTKECGLTYHSKLKAKEKKLLAENNTSTLDKKEFYQINTQSCEDCRECVEMTGCPGLTQISDAYGPKMAIDPNICVADSYCTKLKACPSFEKVIVHEYHPTLYKKNTLLQQDINVTATNNSRNEITTKAFHIVVTGVGGSGVTTISKILSNAVAFECVENHRIDFKFFDQKGLAQRNGAVLGHLTFFPKGKNVGPITPKGMADLLISPDLLEGARNIDYLSPEGLLILDSDFQIPLSIMLDSGIDKDVITQEQIIQDLKNKLGKRLHLIPFKKISTQIFHKSVYSTTMMLGYLSQQNLLPLEAKTLIKALKSSVPKIEVENNEKAFLLGCNIALSGYSQYLTTVSNESSWLESLVDSFLWATPKLVKKFNDSCIELQTLFPSIPTDNIAHYVHDLFIYDRGKNIRQFINEAKILQNFYQDTCQIPLRILAKTYFIKDEVFISHILVNKVKKKEDTKFYSSIGKSFDLIHINRPSIQIGEKKWELDMHPKDWMLKIVRHLRFIRPLLPSWHKKERETNIKIRSELINKSLSEKRLKELDSIKGYRQVRYRRMDEVLRKC